MLLGPANIRETVTVDATGNHYSGIFTIDQFATDGKMVPAHVGRLRTVFVRRRRPAGASATSAGSSTRRAGSPPERAAVAAAIQAPLRLAQQVAQYHGVIAARIVRGVEQRHALLRGALPQ